MEAVDKIKEDGPVSQGESVISSADSKKHLARNTGSQIFLFIFSIITSLYFVRYQIQQLGIANYGMVTLATQIVSWTQVAAIAIVGTIGRFVTLNIARGDNKQARSYFNTQVTTVIGLSAVLLPVAALVSYITPVFVKIPYGEVMNTRLLFFLTYLTFIVALYSATFQVTLYVKQRFDIRNMLEVANQISGYAIWILLFSLFRPSLWHIGFGRVIGAAVLLMGTVYTFLKLTPDLKPDLRGYDPSKFKEMIKMGTWMTISQVGIMLYLSFDALVINRTLGPASVGRYGTVAGLSVMIRGLSATMLSILGPPVIAYYARQDWTGLQRAVTKAVKFTSLGIAIALGAFCGLSVPFLTWWLGPSFGSLHLLVWLLFPHMVLNLGMDPPSSVTYAANKMAVPGIATILGGLLKVALAVILIKYTRLGLYGVAIADMISLSVKNLIFQPIYVSRLLQSSSLPFYKAVVPSIFVFSAVSLTALALSRITHSATFSVMAVEGLAVVMVFSGLTYLLVLNRDDREFLRQSVPWRKKRTV
ncbi:MAG TPA: oligosaccharide flippase family protein [Armatimonadota bacterium]|nr:oligosaccharide flippase family protein [Armatimonadota bacterium]